MTSHPAPNPGRGFWPVTLRQAGVLLAVAVGLTALVWAVRPDRLPLVADAAVYELELAAPLVTPAEALVLFDDGDFLFLDTRPVDPGTVDTISGAFTLRAATFDDDLRLLTDIFLPEDPLLLFGDGDLSPVSNLAARLQARGYENLVILKGGLADWARAGGETTPAETGGTP